ncbi:MAG: PEP-CTERM sorting domain-containing protein [Akkermansiaceae bacterium]
MFYFKTFLLTAFFVSVSHAAVVVGTEFTGRSISGTTVTIDDYILSGVSNPGAWTVVGAGGFMTSTDAADHFAVDDNPPNWNVTIPLEVGALAVVLDDVTIDFESFNNSEASKIPTGFAPNHFANVILRNDGGSIIAQQSLDNDGGPNDNDPAWTGIYSDFSSVVLNPNKTYSLQIVSSGVSGNNVSLDSFFVNGNLIPEPSSFLLGCIGVGFFSLRRRR